MEFELSTPMRVIIALFLVVVLIGVVVWLMRRFGRERVGNAAARGRQPRLAVIDAAAVDGRRRLVLIRRDNVEHLIMIGGPTDVVVETNIVRAAPAREPIPQRSPPAAEAPPRAVALGEGSLWPLQPEPAARPEQAARPEPVTRLEPPSRAEPPPRPARPLPLAEEAAQRAEAEATPPRERRPRAADPLIGLAQELGRAPAPEDAAAEPPARPAPRREPRAPRPAPAPPPASSQADDPQFNPAADQNLAEMAQRLEAALRRPARSDEGRSTPAAAAEADSGSEPASPATSREPARSTRAEGRSARGAAAPAPQKSLYDSLEQEMASLLGRPGSKP